MFFIVIKGHKYYEKGTKSTEVVDYYCFEFEHQIRASYFLQSDILNPQTAINADRTKSKCNFIFFHKSCPNCRAQDEFCGVFFRF